MKRFILLLILSSSFAPRTFAQKQMLDQVVAVVNDEAITQSELDMLLHPLYLQYRQEMPDKQFVVAVNDARKKLLNQLIEDHLVFQEAKKRNIKADDEEIDAQMEEFKKRFKNEAELEEALKKEGMTLTVMRERLERQAMVRQLHDMEIRSKIVVSPLEVEEYYKANPGEFSSQEKLKVRSLTLRKNDEARKKGLTDEQARKKMQQIRKKILSGGDFDALAKQYSEDTNAKQGGLGEWIERGAMIPAIDDVIFKLKPGEVSEIIETEMGYHIFRVEERKDSQKKTFEQAREEIFARIFQKKAMARFHEWMMELKRNSYISLR